MQPAADPIIPVLSLGIAFSASSASLGWLLRVLRAEEPGLNRPLEECKKSGRILTRAGILLRPRLLVNKCYAQMLCTSVMHGKCYEWVTTLLAITCGEPRRTSRASLPRVLRGMSRKAADQ